MIYVWVVAGGPGGHGVPIWVPIPVWSTNRLWKDLAEDWRPVGAEGRVGVDWNLWKGVPIPWK